MIYPKANQPRLKLLKHTRTYILIMPRGNRKANLSTRLAAIPKRGIVPQAEIPGSEEWSRLRAPAKLNTDFSESFFENYTHEERQHYLKYCIPRTVKTGATATNEVLIDNINRWVDGNGWQYIEGGEYDGSWVNPQYPNRIFEGNSMTLPITGDVSETVEFPVSSHEDDPIGLACHFRVSCAGTKREVLPNRWTEYDSTRRGRKQRRSNERKARRQMRGEAFAEANKIQNAEKRENAIAELKSKFHMEDVKRERAKMGIDEDA